MTAPKDLSSPLVSVVVPVYDGGWFLNECIDSICHQTYPNIEIICVDDGANDLSKEVLHNIARVRPTVRVISLMSNHGVGYARNIGVQNARGKYLLFVDNDDFISPRLIEKLVWLAEYNHADTVSVPLVVFDNMTLRKIKNTVSDSAIPPDSHLCMSDYASCIRKDPLYYIGLLSSLSYLRLFRLAFLQRIPFVEDLVCEDLLFFYEVTLSEKVKVIFRDTQNCYYYRFNRMGSIMDRIKSTWVLSRDMIHITSRIKEAFAARAPGIQVYAKAVRIVSLLNHVFMVGTFRGRLQLTREILPIICREITGGSFRDVLKLFVLLSRLISYKINQAITCVPEGAIRWVISPAVLVFLLIRGGLRKLKWCR